MIVLLAVLYFSIQWKEFHCTYNAAVCRILGHTTEKPPERTVNKQTSHQQLARNNFSALQALNAQQGVNVTLRVDAGSPPARLQHIAERAAQAGDLRSMHPADHASHTNAQWDELRVWDPGD